MSVKKAKYGASMLMSISAMLAVSFAGQAWLLADAAPTTTTPELASAKQKMAQGKHAEACTLLKKAVEKSPNSCEMHLAYGKALCAKAKADKAKNQAASAQGYIAARNALRRAIRIGKGSAAAKEANAYMMANVPADYLKPRIGEGTEMIASLLGLHGRDRGIGDSMSKPKVFEFYADWCEPCKLLKPVMDKAKAEYGDQVEFVSYNVDDQKNAQFIDQYEVSPIPTIIFLTPDNQVVSYSIGFAGEKNVQKNLEKILPSKEGG